MRIITIFLVLTLMPAGAFAAEPSAAAQAIIDNARQECNGMDNGKFHATEQAVTLHDITGDGQPEEIIDASQFSCSTAASLWGGSGGTYLSVVVAGKQHEFLAHRWKLIDFDGQNVLLLAVHSSQCSDDIGPCYRALVWQDGFRSTRVGIE